MEPPRGLLYGRGPSARTATLRTQAWCGSRPSLLGTGARHREPSARAPRDHRRASLRARAETELGTTQRPAARGERPHRRRRSRPASASGLLKWVARRTAEVKSRFGTHSRGVKPTVDVAHRVEHVCSVRVARTSGLTPGRAKSWTGSERRAVEPRTATRLALGRGSARQVGDERRCRTEPGSSSACKLGRVAHGGPGANGARLASGPGRASCDTSDARCAECSRRQRFCGTARGCPTHASVGYPTA